MLAFSCSQCGKALRVKDELVGKKIKCPGCGELMRVPRIETAAVSDAGKRSPPAPGFGAEEKTLAPSLGALQTDVPTLPPGEHPSGARPVPSSVGETAGGSQVDLDGRQPGELIEFLAPPQAADEIGRLGTYRVLKVLGAGGMGVVFKAEDPQLARLVALKAMLPALAASPSARQRFLREARLAAAISHDHIVHIYQVGEDRGVPFMAMQFLEGEPLDERLKRQPRLPLAEMLRIGREVAEGLAAAHKRALIHRDIKPANIWLEADKGRVKILDFGLARATSDQAHLTQSGAIIGTPAYMAPEQAGGQTIDHRCDLFSLGCVLYRMAAGKLPFRGHDTITILTAIALEAPRPPRQLNPQIPAGLSDLILQLLAKKADDRPATTQAVVDALTALERDLTTILPASPPKREMRTGDNRARRARPARAADRAPGSRRLYLFGGVAAALACLIAALVLFWPTSNGTVRIDINDPDVKVAVDKDEFKIQGIDKHDIVLAPGEHGLRIKRGDLEFETGKFVLKKGETVTLKIELLKGKLQVVNGEQVIGEKALPAISAAGPKGAYALSFEPGHVVKLPTLILDRKAPYTLEVFVTPTADSYKGYPHCLVIPDQTALEINGKGGLWHCFVRTEEEKPLRALSAVAVVKNRRTHVAAVRTDKQLRLYVDGKLVKTAALLEKRLVAPSKKPAQLGDARKLFKGLIDKARISKGTRYDKSFTPAQRFEPDADTLALYRFDEGQGDVLKDSSGNGHHGLIVGAKWVEMPSPP